MSTARLLALLVNGTNPNDLAFRTPYDGLNDAVEEKLICKDESLALQSERDSCDINFIMKNYIERGEIPPYTREGTFADVTTMPSYEQGMEAIARAEAYFDRLPQHIRNIFNDNPGTFLDFMADPDNLEMSYEIGVRQKPEDTSAPPTPAAPTAPTPPAPPAPPTGSGTSPAA